MICEERLLAGRYGREYARYCESTPRFIPRLRSQAGECAFSVRRVCDHDEYSRVLGTAVMSALFGLMAYLPFIAPLELLAERL